MVDIKRNLVPRIGFLFLVLNNQKLPRHKHQLCESMPPIIFRHCICVPVRIDVDSICSPVKICIPLSLLWMEKWWPSLGLVCSSNRPRLSCAFWVKSELLKNSKSNHILLYSKYGLLHKQQTCSVTHCTAYSLIMWFGGLTAAALHVQPHAIL